MTYDQYWYGDVWMVRAFYKADKLRRENEDYNAWVSGLYVKSAIEATIGNVFKEKGAQPIEYPAKPYYLQEQEEQQRAKKREDQELAFAKLYMYNMIRAGKEWGNH